MRRRRRSRGLRSIIWGRNQQEQGWHCLQLPLDPTVSRNHCLSRGQDPWSAQTVVPVAHVATDRLWTSSSTLLSPLQTQGKLHYHQWGRRWVVLVVHKVHVHFQWHTCVDHECRTLDFCHGLLPLGLQFVEIWHEQITHWAREKGQVHLLAHLSLQHLLPGSTNWSPYLGRVLQRRRFIVVLGLEVAHSMHTSPPADRFSLNSERLD